METVSPHFEQFVRAVHVRMVIVRAAERVGLCVLAGCVAALVLMPVLMYRGEATGAIVLAAVGAGAAAGIGWAMTTRPTRLAAAMEADRQLRLSDLLGTAWMVRGGAGDDFTATVLALAEAKCRAASPAAVALHRLGPRGWGGIGVVAALVAGLYLLGPESKESAARAAAVNRPQTWQEIEAARDRANEARSVATPDMRRPKVGLGGDEDPLKSAVPDANQQGAATATDRTSANEDGGNSASQDGAGGSGSAQSPTKGATGANDPTTGGAGKTGTGGSTSAGGAGGATDGGANNGVGGATAGENPKARQPAPVWQGANWAADRDAARAAIRGGRVPDAYRDLVREYFERE